MSVERRTRRDDSEGKGKALLRSESERETPKSSLGKEIRKDIDILDGRSGVKSWRERGRRIKRESIR